MNEGFYKTSRAMLGRTDLTPAEKLVRIVRAHFQAFEGRAATARELAAATGLSERGVRKILSRRWTARFRQLAARSAEQSSERSSERSSGKAEQSSAPSCSKSLSSVRDVDKGERHAPPSPGDAQGGKTTSSLALLHLKAVAGGGKWPLARWIGQVEEDTAARRYFRADLEAFVAHRTSITEAPWKLAEAVQRHAEATKAAAFRERLRTIRVEGLSDARAAGDRRRWRVRYADEGDGLLILETVVRANRATVEGLERMLAGQKRLALDPQGRGPAAQSLRRRIEAIRAGLPDPDPPEVPKPERREIRSLADLAGWRFRPYQPRLFE